MRIISRRPAAMFGALAAITVCGVSAGSASAAIKLPSYSVTKIGITSGSLSSPFQAALSPNGKTLYVAALRSGLITIPLAKPKNAKTLSACGGVGATPGPAGVAVSANGKTLYVTCPIDSVAEAITIGSGKTTAISEGSFDIQEAGGLALSSNGKLLYLANEDPTEPVLVADVSGGGAKNDTVIGDIAGSGASTDDGQAGVAISPNGKTLYESNFVETGGGSMNIDVANIAGVSVTHPSAGRLTGSIATKNPNGNFGLEVSPDGKTLYVAGDGGPLEAIDLATGAEHDKVIGSLSSKISDAEGLAMTPNGRGLYATLAPDLGTGPVGIDKVTIPAAATKATINGTAERGKTVRAKVKAGPGASLSYTWRANGKAIMGATKAKLKIAKSLAGKRLTVKVTASAVGYSPATVTSKAVPVKK
jgi:DNA-binding beta-propeller fold protein YncE